MIAESLNVGGGVRLVIPAKLYLRTQTHYTHDEDGRTAPGVRGHGSVPLFHVVTRIGSQHQIPFVNMYCINDCVCIIVRICK